MKTGISRKLVSLVLCLCILFSVLPMVFASNSYTINGVTIHWDDFSSSPDECWAYANAVYKKIWGYNFNNSFSDTDNSLRDLADSELTATARVSTPASRAVSAASPTQVRSAATPRPLCSGR